jgi:hypothetical protein
MKMPNVYWAPCALKKSELFSDQNFEDMVLGLTFFSHFPAVRNSVTHSSVLGEGKTAL